MIFTGKSVTSVAGFSSKWRLKNTNFKSKRLAPTGVRPEGAVMVMPPLA